MKIMKIMALIFAGVTLSFTSGCLTTKPETVTEPTLESTQKTELIESDIEVIEQNDTTGRVSAAKEAATKILSDAKKEATDIRQAAEKVMALKTYEAEKRAEEIMTAMKKKAKSQKSELIKEYLKEQSDLAKEKAAKLIETGKKRAAEMIAESNKYASTIGAKAKKEYDKIAKQMIKNAKKSVSDLTKMGGVDAAKIRDASKKLFQDAKIFTELQKKVAEDYLAKKMKETDLAMEKITEKLKKSEDAEKGAKPALAETILTQIMTGMKNNNYEKFSAHFAPSMKERFTEKKFKALNAQLKGKIGDYKKRSYLGSLKKGVWRVYLWKSEFTNAKENELILRLVIGELDNKQYVFGFDISNL